MVITIAYNTFYRTIQNKFYLQVTMLNVYILYVCPSAEHESLSYILTIRDTTLSFRNLKRK